MSYDFSGKVVVVAGGSGALGQAVIEAFRESGATVIAPGRGHSGEKATASENDTGVLDAQNEESVRRFFEALQTRHGGLDVLVSLVGGYTAGDPVSALDLSVFQGQIDLNLKTDFLLTKYALQAMEPRGSGKIVLTASRAAVDKGANSFAYSVSKAGVVRLVEAAAAENRDRNININAILPGIIDTPANRQSMPKAKFEKWTRPEQIARVILFLASDDAEPINGAAIPVYGKA